MKRKALYALVSLFVFCTSFAQDKNSNVSTQANICNGNYIESGGLVVVEIESQEAVGGWTKKTDVNDYSGEAYFEWTGSAQHNNPGNGLLEYPIQISNPGTYHFRWRSKVGYGTSATEHNDTWLKIPDADDFYADKGGHIVHPHGVCNNDCPNGSGKDGWFKVYSSGTTNWTWSARTSDNDAHEIYADFNTPGIYTVQISGRSQYHLLDRFVLHNVDLLSTEEATDLNNPVSNCGSGVAQISGELKKWHKVILTFDGPQTSETATPNPFLDYRLNVTFTNGDKAYVVPGYYAADGNAANSSATSGNKWRAHFAPDEEGQWTYSVSYREGINVAVSDDANAGSSAGHMDAETGTFTIGATDKTGRDHRGKGRLQYVGGHYLRFAETGEYFLKQGADAPENLLAYEDFDGNFKSDGQKDDLIKTWSAHVQDWNTGDPTWKNGKGKGIIGAINYLASEGMNVFSFLPMNINGDDRNVFPYTDYNERVRFDCSKLDQWEILFEHADQLGMYLHFKTQETENDHLLDGGDLGIQRKLYYRELIARFAHHLALNWNLGEENTNTDAQRKSFAQYFKDVDPYDHNIVVHTYPGDDDKVFGPMLGNNSHLTGTSIQTSSSDFSQVHGRVLEWVEKSANAGKPWIVACDEPGDASHALRPDDDVGNSHEDGRKNALWGTLMAGGAGNEWYFGYQHAHSDLTCQDFRSRDHWWDYCRYALQFFTENNIPYWEMKSNDGLTSATNDYCFAREGEVYIVYSKDASGTGTINLTNDEYSKRWFDPRNGTFSGNEETINGGSNTNIGSPPSDNSKDWVALFVNKGSLGNQCAVSNITAPAANSTFTEGDNITIKATASDPDGSVAKVEFYNGGTKLGEDTNSPYEFTWQNVPAGNYNLKVIAVDDKGKGCSSLIVSVTVNGGGNQMAVVSLTLIDADADIDIQTLNDGDTIYTGDLPTMNLNIRANTQPYPVGSVRFSLNGNDNYSTENITPYALAGDNNGDYKVWTPALGEHILSATPYSESGGGGTAGNKTTIRFYILDWATSVMDREKVEISVFPNPTTDQFTIKWNDPSKIKALTVVDAVGRVVLQARQFEHPTFQVDLNDAQSGVFFVKVALKDGTEINRKLVVVE